MPIIWDHERDFPAVEDKPDGVVRILCLGDSLTYGAGVQYSETLPAQLERLLNRGLWDRHIEVVNGGVSGYALYDGWLRFIHRLHRYRPDQVAVILCDNDAELFSVNVLRQMGRTVDYERHVEACWKEDGAHFPYFLLTLSDMSAEMKRLGVPLTLAYYDVYGKPVNSVIARRIAQACEACGADFVDLSADFTGASSAYKNTSFRIGDEDGHPSAAAHGVAAQRLARFLAARHFPADSLPAAERHVWDHLIRQTADSIQAGYPREQALSRLAALLDAKHGGKPRARLLDDLRESDQALADLMQGMRALADGEARLQAWEAYAIALGYWRQPFFERRAELDALSRAVYRGLLVLEKQLENPSLGYVRYFDPDPGCRPGDVLRTFASQQGLSAALSGGTQGLQALLRETFPGGAPLDPLRDSAWLHRINQAAARIQPFWRELETAGNSLETLFGMYQSLGEKLAASSSPETLAAYDGLAVPLRQLLASHEHWSRLVRLPDENPTPSDKLARPVTTCTVHLKSNAAEPFTLWVQATPLSPPQRPISDMRWMRRDGQTHAYRFEFPRFLFGQVSLQINPLGEAELEKVEIRNSSGQTIVFTAKLDAAGRCVLPPVLLDP
ncbi:MAG: SGNH/GDSL hydrolase family protein [Myxococcales bacterium]|nr:MAG: SGNH/GDSL hydrolase family protein [Myxococcales bacterium]